MDKIWHNLKLDLADGGSQGEITVRANDAATQVLNVQLRTNGKAYKLADDVVATLHGTRRDGTALYNACYIEDNCIRMELKSELLGVAGRVECVIKLVGTEPATLTTPGFDIYVEAVPDDGTIEAADSFNALVVQTAETKALQMEIEQKLAAGEFDGEDGYSPEVTVTPIEDGYRLYVKNKDTEYSVDIIAPEKGEQGVGIESAVLNADYTLTLNFTDGSKYTTPSIRGKDGDAGVSPEVSVTQITNGHRVTIVDSNGIKSFDVLNGSKGDSGNDGITPAFSIGTVTTLAAGSNATASIGGTAEKPVLNLGIPKGADGKDGEDAEGGGGTMDHAALTNRDAADQHPMSAITGLEAALAGKQPTGDYLKDGDVPSWAMEETKPSYTATEVGALPSATPIPTKTSDLDNDKGFITGYTETDPTVPAWAKSDKKPTYTASEVGARPDTWMPTPAQVGADPTGTATSAVSSHNTNKDSHNDIRLLIAELADRLDALADSDDETLDQMAEVVAYIKANRDLIDQITTGKVSVTDIINNLTTNVSNKPLSAAQGVELKALIDAITIPTKLSELTDDKGYLTAVPSEYVTETELSAKKYLTAVPSEYVTETELTAKGYIAGYTETDPTVPSWAKAESKPSYTKAEVGLDKVDNVKQYSASNPPPYPVTSVNGSTGAVKLTIPTVPTNVSAFTNDAGYITGYTETDPTVPSWAKAASKPSYSASEVGAVPTSRTINGKALTSNITLSASDVSAVPTSRTINGKALSSNITLSASDVSAVPTSSALTVTGIDANGATHTWTMYGVKN